MGTYSITNFKSLSILDSYNPLIPNKSFLVEYATASIVWIPTPFKATMSFAVIPYFPFNMSIFVGPAFAFSSSFSSSLSCSDSCSYVLTSYIAFIFKL